jgi:formyltetrahydrofolate synthetase
MTSNTKYQSIFDKDQRIHWRVSYLLRQMYIMNTHTLTFDMITKARLSERRAISFSFLGHVSLTTQKKLSSKHALEGPKN